MSDVTELLTAIDAGDPKAADELPPLVYAELRKLAVVWMANEKPAQALQPTALVHEAWLKIAGGPALGLRPSLVETHHPKVSFWPDESGLKIFWIQWRDLHWNLACQDCRAD